MNYCHREEGWKESKSIIYRNKYTQIRDTSLRSKSFFRRLWIRKISSNVVEVAEEFLGTWKSLEDLQIFQI